MPIAGVVLERWRASAMPIVLRAGRDSSSGTSIVAHSRSPHAPQRSAGGAVTAGRDVVVTGAAKPGATVWIDVVGRAVADGRGVRRRSTRSPRPGPTAIVAASATRGLDLGRGCIVVIIPALRRRPGSGRVKNRPGA